MWEAGKKMLRDIWLKIIHKRASLSLFAALETNDKWSLGNPYRCSSTKTQGLKKHENFRNLKAGWPSGTHSDTLVWKARIWPGSYDGDIKEFSDSCPRTAWKCKVKDCSTQKMAFPKATSSTPLAAKRPPMFTLAEEWRLGSWKTEAEHLWIEHSSEELRMETTLQTQGTAEIWGHRCPFPTQLLGPW